MDLRHLPRHACNFLQQSPGFLDWHRSPSGAILVVTGGRGTGKYLATSFLADHLFSTRRPATILYYAIPAWKERNSKTMSVKYVLRCLISSLISQRPDLFNRSRQESMSPILRIFQNVIASDNIHAISKLLSTLIDHVHKLDIIVDGVDTCPDRVQLVRELVSIKSTSRNWRQSVRLLVGDQLDYEVRQLYGEVHRIDLKVGDINCKLSTYVPEQLQKYLPDRSDIHAELQEKILLGSNGAIGWARYIISLLASPAAMSSDTKFFQYVDEASNGCANELGRRIDEIRNRSSKRRYVLIILILRRFVKRSSRMSARELVSLVRSNSDMAGDCDSFTHGEKEIVSVAFCLSTPPVALLKESNELFRMSKVIRSYFLQKVPATIPKIPPLWLEGDTCVRLACHFERQSRSQLQGRCEKHKDETVENLMEPSLEYV